MVLEVTTIITNLMNKIVIIVDTTTMIVGDILRMTNSRI